MFQCKVCLEKDKRIADLKEQISQQRLLLNPPPRVNHYEMEQDFITNGATQEELAAPTPINSEAQRKLYDQMAAIQLEQEQMLAGDTIEIPYPSAVND